MFGLHKLAAKNKGMRGAAGKHVQKGGRGFLAKVFNTAGNNAQKKKQPGR